MENTAFIYDYVCLPPARQIGEHSQPTWELVGVVCGAGTRTVGDQTEPMSVGEIILIPPYIPHVWRFDQSVTDAYGNIANMAVFFESSVLDGLEMIFPEVRPSVNRLKSLNRAVAYTGKIKRRIYELLYAMRDLTSEARLPMMIELLLLASNTDNCSVVGCHKVIRKSEQRMENIRVFCSCNYARSISLDEIASYVGMNKSAFCTFMRRHAGKSFSEYINCYRLEKAFERLKHTDDDIAAIAYDTGFANVSYFNRLFKSKYGCTPRNVRKYKDSQ